MNRREFWVMEFYKLGLLLHPFIHVLFPMHSYDFLSAFLTQDRPQFHLAIDTTHHLPSAWIFADLSSRAS
jgi:hypothetical protein